MTKLRLEDDYGYGKFNGKVRARARKKYKLVRFNTLTSYLVQSEGIMEHLVIYFAFFDVSLRTWTKYDVSGPKMLNFSYYDRFFSEF